MKHKYVKVNDIMELINTSNRGTCDYFIVDQIEKLCKSEKVYDVDKVVEQLRKLPKCSTWNHNSNNIDRDKAIEIVKGGGK